MRTKTALALLIALSVSFASIAFDYEQVGKTFIPRGQIPAAFHYGKMTEALINGNVRLAKAHARARIPHMTLSYRSSSYYIQQAAESQRIQLEALSEFENPSESKPESGIIRIQLHSDPTKEIQLGTDPTREIQRMLEESSEMIEKLIPIDAPPNAR